MDLLNLPFYQNNVLFGYNPATNIVAVEIEEKEEPPQARLYFRRGGTVEWEERDFHPWIIVRDLSFMEGFKGDWNHRELTCKESFNYIIYFNSFKTLKKALDYLKKTTKHSYGSPHAPYLYYSDTVHQYLLTSGMTLFKGMRFEDILRMQIDIETYCQEGFEFSNPDREKDRIIIIAMSDSTGWKRIISGREFDEASMIREMVKEIRQRDPDVLEGHNFHKFDLDYIEKRAKRHKVSLNIGRDGSLLKSHPSRLNIAERTITFPKYEVYGRHIIDTWILAQLYDVSARELETYGLKDIARHFHVAPPDRVYVESWEIYKTFDTEPEKLEKYAGHDVEETNAISKILSPPYFIQSQIFPYSYQNVTSRGNATRINSLFIREYIRRGHAIPAPPPDKTFIGGWTGIFTTGVIQRVLHVDVASLYPSIMLTFKYFPQKDNLKVFEGLLADLRSFRLSAKKSMKTAQNPQETDFFNSLQTTFKILINSFYGYLGFSMGNFADFTMAENVTAKGREILQTMVEWLKNKECKIIEVDTDGIYFSPPADLNQADEEKLVAQLDEILPGGINIELDGRYKAMFSYKMKNYILMDYNNELFIKGSGLRSRGLEYFQRKFIEEMFYLLLMGKKQEIPKLLESYQLKILSHKMDIKWFQKSETLQESLDSYKEKIKNSDRNRSAVYELALASQREYAPGDQISYYITGTTKKVTGYKNCKPSSQWDPKNPDENVKYYADKLDALYKKFAPFI